MTEAERGPRYPPKSGQTTPWLSQLCEWCQISPACPQPQESLCEVCPEAAAVRQAKPRNHPSVALDGFVIKGKAEPVWR